MWEYYIKNGNWVHPSGFACTVLGVCISVDKPSLYDSINYDMRKETITLQKHGDINYVKSFYLYIVDTPLRNFCDFYYLQLAATEINAENLNKIISTSCLPKKYLDKLIDENNRVEIVCKSIP
jgi:hypothetical protein